MPASRPPHPRQNPSVRERSRASALRAASANQTGGAPRIERSTSKVRILRRRRFLGRTSLAPKRAPWFNWAMNERAGTPARDQDLIDVDALISAYYDIEPDPADPLQAVVFGTSGHRGSSFDGAFNEAHIAATTQAIVEYRKAQGYDGPLFIGRDTHGLSAPAERTAIEVLVANDVDVRVDSRGSWTPTPSVSLAILRANGAGTAAGVRQTGSGLADGIVITPSHNPPRDGGFKYNPPTGGPADTDATTRLMRAEETRVLPTAVSAFHPGRCWNR